MTRILDGMHPWRRLTSLITCTHDDDLHPWWWLVSMAMTYTHDDDLYPRGWLPSTIITSIHDDISHNTMMNRIHDNSHPLRIAYTTTCTWRWFAPMICFRDDLHPWRDYFHHDNLHPCCFASMTLTSMAMTYIQDDLHPWSLLTYTMICIHVDDLYPCQWLATITMIYDDLHLWRSFASTITYIHGDSHPWRWIAFRVSYIRDLLTTTMITCMGHTRIEDSTIHDEYSYSWWRLASTMIHFHNDSLP